MTNKHLLVFAVGAVCWLTIVTCGGETSDPNANGGQMGGELLIGIENGMLMIDTSETDQPYVVLGRTAAGGPVGNDGQDSEPTHWSSTANLLAEVQEGDEVWVYRLVPAFKVEGLALLPCLSELCVPPPPPPPPAGLEDFRDWTALQHFELPPLGE